MTAECRRPGRKLRVLLPTSIFAYPAHQFHGGGPLKTANFLIREFSERGDVLCSVLVCGRREYASLRVSRRRVGHLLEVVRCPYLLWPVLLRRGQYDVIMIHGTGRGALYSVLLGKLLGIPVAYVAHGDLRRLAALGAPYGIGSRIQEGIILRSADAIIAVSHLLRRVLTNDHRYLDRREIKVVYNGIECAWCDPWLSHDGHADSADSAGERHPIILTVGCTTYAKGADLLLQVAKDLDCQVRLVGSDTSFLGHLRQKYETEFDRGKFVHVGPLYGRDLCTAYRAADIFVLPSRFDSFPFTVLEAMLHRLPVIVSNQVGVKEIMEDGVDGFIVPLSDLPSWRQRIGELLADANLRHQMGLSASRAARRLT